MVILCYRRSMGTNTATVYYPWLTYGYEPIHVANFVFMLTITAVVTIPINLQRASSYWQQQ